MSKAERKFVHQSVDDRQADEFVQEHLGGGDPGGPVGGDEDLPD